jgi:DNA-binding Xre family transcriptional regulator
MENQHITKKELARRLGKSKSCVGQMLDGKRNMTLGSLSDLCFELGVKPRVIITTDSNHHPFKKADWKESNVTEFKRVVTRYSGTKQITPEVNWG